MQRKDHRGMLEYVSFVLLFAFSLGSLCSPLNRRPSLNQGTLPTCNSLHPRRPPLESDCYQVYLTLTDMALRMGDPDIFGTRAAQHGRYVYVNAYTQHVKQDQILT